LKNIILRRVSIFEFLHSQGQKRRLVQWTAAPRLPLYTVRDRTRAALKYIAMSHKQKSPTLNSDVRQQSRSGMKKDG
jgi:hypothetical protein